MEVVNVLGSMELLVIAGIGLLLFGPKQLPGLAKGAGKAIREFRKQTDRK